MEKKIPFQNRLFALIISLLFSITLIFSLFALPLELVFFNRQSYIPFLENEENVTRYPEIISQVLATELFKGIPSEQLPRILSNKTGLISVLKRNISAEWSLSVFTELSNQVLDYFNFRIPNTSINLEIGQLKSDLILKSESIALDYISKLPRCSADINNEFTDNNIVQDIYQLPSCKPSNDLERSFIIPTALYIEDSLNRLPDSISISGVMPFDTSKADNYFYYYSLGRWALRLLTIIAIGLLIVITLLLHSERNVMLNWVGRLLVSTSGIGLIGLVILLIGFDQFVVLLTNRYLNNLIGGFDVFLLGLIQDLGYLTLVWVIISLIMVLAFGLLLLLVNRLFKPKTNLIDDLQSKEDSIIKEVPLYENQNGENLGQKEFEPETLEEIEAHEKKNSKKKKSNNSSA